MTDITSVGAVFIISVPQLLPIPQQIQGFAVEDIFDFDDIDAAETMMGADGRLSGGLINVPKPQNISLQADSPSISFFDAWYHGQIGLGAAFPAVANITLTSVNTSWALTTGFLRRYKPVPDAKKVLQPRKFRIEWQTVLPVPVGISG